MLGKWATTLAIVLSLALDSTCRAEHLAYYRYIVVGYVRDAAGQARPGVEVELVREKTGFSYLGATDAAGLYVIVARLGDESVGERLSLRAAGAPVTIVAHFDPKDHVRERGTQVDFIGSRPIESPAAFAATLRRFLEQ